jgi:hypothetical protein
MFREGKLPGNILFFSLFLEGELCFFVSQKGKTVSATMVFMSEQESKSRKNIKILICFWTSGFLVSPRFQ